MSKATQKAPPKLIAARTTSADRRLETGARAKVVMGIDGDTGNVKKMLVSADGKKHESEIENSAEVCHGRDMLQF